MKQTIGCATYIRLKTKPEKREEFVRLIRDLRANVHAQEPGTLVFELLQGAHANEFVMFEGFVDAAARETHAQAAYHLAMSAQGWACLDGEPIIEMMNPAC